MKSMKISAFLAVYVIWGSTYLAIRYAIESLPPWTLSSLRFFLAGGLMFLIARVRGESLLDVRQLRVAAISGAMLVFANGIVGVAEKWMPSGVVAVVIGLMPIWIMLMGWALFREARPTFGKIAGALIGLAGIALIAKSQSSPLTAEGYAAYGLLILLISSWTWAGGTLIQRKALQVKSAFLFSSVQMLSGAVFVGIVSLIFEKPWAHDWAAVSASSWAALAYLVVFGSVVAFTAYAWLSRNVTPSLLSTYALVNPIIAVYLGWLFLSEPLTLDLAFATVLVLIGLAFLMAPSLLPTFGIGQKKDRAD